MYLFNHFVIIIFKFLIQTLYNLIYTHYRPLFLPDPRDGSLYLLHNKDKVGIKKLDVTIPQLVANSPCRSSDGILFSGK